MKNWSGSRVEAEGADGEERARRIPARGCNERATPPDTPFCFAPHGFALFSALACVARLVEMARISTLRSRLGQGRKQQQRDPLQYFNSLLERGKNFHSVVPLTSPLSGKWTTRREGAGTSLGERDSHASGSRSTPRFARTIEKYS